MPGPSAAPLAVFYLLYFCTVGVLLPFLPAYLRVLGLSASEAGVAQAVSPVVMLVVPPLWGHLADRSGRHGRVLVALCLGTGAGLVLLWFATSLPEVLLALAVNAAFASAVVPMADALALQHVGANGGTYASIRRFGSVGFVASSLAFGALVHDIDGRVIFIPLVAIGVSAVWAMVALARGPAVVREGPRPELAQALRLLKQPGVRTVLGAGALHWVAATPYHGSLAPHLLALGEDTSLVGVCAAAGVASEVALLSLWPRLQARFRSPRTVILFSVAVSALRWWGMALTDSGWVVVALAGLHGIGFGTFYVASVEWMTQETPDSLRATGQALLFATIFGVGGVAGYATSGWVYDALGGHALFGLAAAFELLPILLLVRARATSE